MSLLLSGTNRRTALFVVTLFVVAVAVACGSNDAATPPANTSSTTPSADTSPSPATIGPSTVQPTATRESDRAPEEILEDLFTYDRRENRVIVSPEAVDEALATGDERFLPPLVELTRWVLLFPERNAVQVALSQMTGQQLEGYDFFNWYTWLGQNYEGEEFDNYADWKARLYNHIDPRFAQWFFNGVESEIPLWTAQWGGVRSDGIPPLDNPKMIPAASAIFMESDEQVFGVSINGEARAYPLRFMNWHEMANDVVGGKPVTLAY